MKPTTSKISLGLFTLLMVFAILGSLETSTFAVADMPKEAESSYTSGIADFRKARDLASRSPDSGDKAYLEAMHAALANFADSYRIKPHSYTAYYMAMCYAYLGNRGAARDYMYKAQRTPPSLVEPLSEGANTLIRWAELKSETVYRYSLRGKSDDSGDCFVALPESILEAHDEPPVYSCRTSQEHSLPDLVATGLTFPLNREWNIQQVKSTGGVWHVTKSGSPYIEVDIEAKGYSGTPEAIAITVYADGGSTGRIELGKGTASRRSPTHFVAGFYIYPSALPGRGLCRFVAVIDPQNMIVEREESNNEIAIPGFVHNPRESY